MSSDSYVGIHGRTPYETVEPHEHMVAEFWEDLNRGICPVCGRTVGWDAGNQKWRVRTNLNVVLLFDKEVKALAAIFERSGVADLHSLIERQVELNKPYVEVEIGSTD